MPTNVLFFPRVAAVSCLLAVFIMPGAFGQPCTYFELQEVFCTDQYVGEDKFGISLSVSGEYLAVGANAHVFYDGETLHGPGAVFVYKRVDVGIAGDHRDDTWAFSQELLPWDTDNLVGTIGYSVGLSGDRIVTGRRGDDTGPGYQSGSAYVYRRSGTTWVPEQKLIPSDAAADLLFGASVSISGDWIAVGSVPDASPNEPATGHAYLFRLDDKGTPDLSDDVWIEHVKIGHPMGHEFDRFGLGVGIHGDWLAVGAPATSAFNNRPVPVYNVGAVYVYHRSDAGTPGDLSDDEWTYEARLVASDEEATDGFRLFGQFLVLDGTRVLVGAQEDGLAEGAGYVFRRDDGGTAEDVSDDRWYEEAKLVASPRSVGDFLGAGVAIKDELIALGAPGHAPPDCAVSAPGAAFVFRFVGGEWIQEQKLSASEPNNSQYFGRSAGIADGQVIIGARDDDTAADNAGSAYIFSMVNDCNQNCMPDEEDIAGGTSGDCDANGVPDECEDCTGNGLANACDIAAGAPDCNANGLPDECDRDCNGDGSPDDCATTCTDHCECDDFSACTLDYCADGACTHTSTAYGDVTGNGVINLLDIFGVLDQIAGANGSSTMHVYDIKPCNGDDVVNLSDVFAVLGAIAGKDPCWCVP